MDRSKTRYTLITAEEAQAAIDCGMGEAGYNELKTHGLVDSCSQDKCEHFGDIASLPEGFTWEDTYPVKHYDNVDTGEVNDIGDPIFETTERVEQEILFSDGRHLTYSKAVYISGLEKWKPQIPAEEM